MKSIKLGCVVLTAAALGGCGANDPASGGGDPSTSAGGEGTAEEGMAASADAVPRQPLPTTSGTFRGHYVVPAPPELTAAAHFSVDAVDWFVNRGRVLLRYYLPVGLVGGTLEVEFTGALSPGAGSVTLKREEGGSSVCTARGTVVTCHEIFGNLGTLPIDMNVVQEQAAKDYPGPVEDRVAVANVFSSDPIGFVDFDAAPPH